jgi:hypothetical protein
LNLRQDSRDLGHKTASLMIVSIIAEDASRCSSASDAPYATEQGRASAGHVGCHRSGYPRY